MAGRITGEESRVTIAWRQFWIIGLIALAGCSASEPVQFAHDPRLASEEFAEKPNARRAVETIVDEMFGESPDLLRVPRGAGLPEGGRYLAGLVQEGDDPEDIRPVVYYPAGSETPVPIAGGQALYHRHCLHCHGVSGDGQGPTAAFLYPRPRDYRRGLFKFTSTDYGDKPSRDDLRRILHNGIDGTSMPAFKAQMTDVEMEQVIDYVLFLTYRGEVERMILEEASFYEDSDFADEEGLELFREEVGEIAEFEIFGRWTEALEGLNLVEPLTPRVPPTQESIERGRDLFLGLSRDVKLECAGCHGNQGVGDGPSWIDPETFNRYVFLENYDPTSKSTLETLQQIADEQQRRWSDEWGDPLRPADLNRGVYKGGRRPIDLYWRIATGITGTAMPGHVQALSDPDDLWNLVNFVLALPQQPDLLRPDQVQKLGADVIPEAASTAAR